MRATQLLFLLFALFAISFSHFQTSFATGGVINNCPFYFFGFAAFYFRKHALCDGDHGGHARSCPDACGRGSQATYASLREHNRDGG